MSASERERTARVVVIGAGLAGSEAAWQIAQQGVAVTLYEMRPVRRTPAHVTGMFAELVCSNSLRSNLLTNAVGVLKEEMRRLGSLIMAAADKNAVPAGGALAVDRDGFSSAVTRALEQHPLVEIRREEVTELPADGIVVVATGPLTSEALSEAIRRLTGREYLYFYDAAAPIVEKDSIDMEKVFVASRYGKGEAAYLNCPMTEEEFDRFYEALVTAETVPLKDFEKEIYFEGCMPIEVMARRGKQTVLFGPLKPVGLVDPRTGKQPFAVVQLRQDNAAGTLYNMVGFQTHLKWGEQKRVFFPHPRSGKRRVRPLRRHAPQHVHQFPGPAPADVSAGLAADAVFRRADDGRGRLCGVGGVRSRRRNQRGADGPRARSRRVSARYGDRQSGALRDVGESGGFSADERQFRTFAAA